MGAAIRPYLVAGAFVAVLGVITTIYLKGRADEATIAEIDNLKATQEQIDERNQTNQDVQGSDDARKCQLIGGVLVDGQCV